MIECIGQSHWRLTMLFLSAKIKNDMIRTETPEMFEWGYYETSNSIRSFFVWLYPWSQD